MLALHEGQPLQMNLKQIIAAFVEFREEVIRRRTIYELGKARDRAHVLAGLAVAVANIDDVIAMIRKAPDPQSAREQLMAMDWPAEDVAPLIALLDEPGRGVVDGKYRLSEAQARAILELRLHRLTGLERDKIGDDLREIGDRIAEYLEILQSREKLLAILVDELTVIRDKFANERRTSLEEDAYEHDIEDLIQREDMVVTVTNAGYIKRVPVSTYRAQRRGGKGRSGMATRDEDFVSQVYVANTHQPVLFFSSTGMVYKMKVYKLPIGTPQARGKALINLLPLDPGETITTTMALPEDEDSWVELFVMFATSMGNVRRNRLSDFTNVMANGKIAMKLNEGDALVRVRTCTEDDDVVLSTKDGKCIRFPVGDVRVFSGRTSVGVRGIRLKGADSVIAMSILHHVDIDTETRDSYLKAEHAARRLVGGDYTDRAEDKARDEELAAKMQQPDFKELQVREQFVLTMTTDGFGKRSSAYEYRVSGRGGQGITAINLDRGKDEDPSQVIASFAVVDEDQVIMVTDGGQIIRTPVNQVSIVGRGARGVRLFNVSDGENVVSVSRIREDVEDDEEGEGEGEGTNTDVADAEAPSTESENDTTTPAEGES